jgi:hypothetical protein
MGFVRADYDIEVDVWPENWPAVEIFLRLDTQWRVGFGGATGLVYEALYPLLDRFFPDPDEWLQAFDDIQHLESVALRTMRNS